MGPNKILQDLNKVYIMGFNGIQWDVVGFSGI